MTTARMSLISLGALIGYEYREYHIFANGGEGGLLEMYEDERGEVEYDFGV